MNITMRTAACRRALTLLLTTLGFLLFSATTASACTLISAANQPDGWGAAHNVFSSASELILRADCTLDSFTPEIGSSRTGASNFAVYTTGYYYDGSSWQEMSYSPAAGAEQYGTWILGDAEASESIEYQADPTFFAAYTCHWDGGGWNCGCQDEDCGAPAWQLQAVPDPTVPDDPPAGPGAGGGGVGAGGADGLESDCPDVQDGVPPSLDEMNVIRRWSWPEDAWNPVAAGPDLAAFTLPWNVGEMSPGDDVNITLYESDSGCYHRIRTELEPLTNTDLPKGAPGLVVGHHDFFESETNPFYTNGELGFRTDRIETLKISTQHTVHSMTDDARFIQQIQMYLSVDQLPDNCNVQETYPYIDLQVRLNDPGVENTYTGYVDRNVPLAGYEWDVVGDTNPAGASTYYTYHLVGPEDGDVESFDDLDLVPFIEHIIAADNERSGVDQDYRWFCELSAHIEPIAGTYVDVSHDSEVEFNGAVYGASVAQ